MSKTKMIPFFLVFCSFLFIQNSCQQSTITSSKTPPAYSSPMTISTLQSYSTPLSIFEYPDQVTDGNLLLSIKLITRKCSKATEPFEIELTFSNLTGETLTIPADFSIAVSRRGEGGNLIPLITSADGRDILSLEDYQSNDIFATPSNIYKGIPAKQTAIFVVKFLFPQYLVLSKIVDSYNIATPSPGQYFIRFVYSEYYRNENIWHGKAGSNRLSICLTN